MMQLLFVIYVPAMAAARLAFSIKGPDAQGQGALGEWSGI